MKLDGFKAVKDAWVCDKTIVDPFKRLDALFRNTGASLQAWGQQKMGNIKLKMVMASWAIFRLDKVQERRQLSELELWLRRILKLSLLGLASLIVQLIDKDLDSDGWRKGTQTLSSSKPRKMGGELRTLYSI